MATVSDGMSLDEKLAELVRNYPVLYDKSSPYFKNKQMKNAAWKEIAASLGLKTGKRKLILCCVETGRLQKACSLSSVLF